MALEFFLRGITAFSFGVCFLLLSFQWKIIGTAFGVITLLSLPAVDIVHYFRHKGSLVDALIPCLISFLGLGLLFYVLLRKARKDSDFA